MKKEIKRKSLELALILVLLNTISCTCIGAFKISKTFSLIYNGYMFIDILNNILNGLLYILGASLCAFLTLLIMSIVDKKG